MSQVFSGAAALRIEKTAQSRGIAVRSSIYQKFGSFFSYPCETATAEKILSGELIREILELWGELPYQNVPDGESVGLVVPSDTEALEVLYSSLFDNCSGTPAVPMQECMYSKAERRELWEELLRFYAHFGLAFEREAPREPPDHLLVELEFMHYLLFLEYGAPNNGAAPFSLAAHDYLERHLVKWVPLFQDRLESLGTSQPYAYASRLLKDFIKADAGFLTS